MTGILEYTLSLNDKVSSALAKVGGAVNEQLEKWKKVQETINDTQDAIEELATSKGLFSGWGDAVENFATDLSGWLDTGVDSFNGWMDAGLEAVTGVTDKMGSVAGDIAGWADKVQSTTDSISGKLNSVTESLASWAGNCKGVLGSITGWLASATGKVTGAITPLLDWVSSAAGKVSGISNLVQTAAADVTSWVSSMVGNVTGMVTSCQSTVKQMISTGAGAVKETISTATDIFGDVKEGFSLFKSNPDEDMSLLDRAKALVNVIQSISGKVSSLSSLWTGVVDSMTGGFTSLVADVKPQFNEFIENAKGGFGNLKSVWGKGKDLLGIGKSGKKKNKGAAVEAPESAAIAAGGLDLPEMTDVTGISTVQDTGLSGFASGVNNGSGIFEPIPTFGDTAYDHGLTATDDGKSVSESIAAGGERETAVNITLNSLVENMVFNGEYEDKAAEIQNDLETRFIQMLMRASSAM